LLFIKDKVLEIKKAKYRDFNRIQEFLTLIFPQDSPNYYSGFLYNDQLFNPDRVLYIEEDNQIVSSLWSIPRIYKNGNNFIFSMGIANVGTHPDYRGRGYAGDLMKYAISLAHDEEVSFVALVSEIPEYYKKYGFYDIGKLYTTIDGEDNGYNPVIKVSDLEEVVEVSSCLYNNIELITPLRNYAILKSTKKWNVYTSHFIFNNDKADWYEISLSKDIKIYIYALEKDLYYEIFELVFSPELNTKDIRQALKKLSSMKNKPLRLYGHRAMFKRLDLSYESDKETVMCLEIKSIDMDRIYLPVPDYF